MIHFHISYIFYLCALLCLTGCRQETVSLQIIQKIQHTYAPTQTIIAVHHRCMSGQTIIMLLNNLQSQGFCVIVCSNIPVNTPYTGADHNYQQQYQDLKLINFEGSYAHEIIKFNYIHYRPIFYKGILATDLGPIADVLGIWLNALPIHIKNLIYIDTCTDQIMAIKTMCKKRRLRFKSYHVPSAQPIQLQDCLQQTENLTADQLIDQSSAE